MLSPVLTVILLFPSFFPHPVAHDLSVTICAATNKMANANSSLSSGFASVLKIYRVE
jgi:hypothetical protein